MTNIHAKEITFHFRGEVLKLNATDCTLEYQLDAKELNYSETKTVSCEMTLKPRGAFRHMYHKKRRIRKKYFNRLAKKLRL